MCSLSSRQTKKQKNLQKNKILSSPPAAQQGEIFVTRRWQSNTRKASYSLDASGNGEYCKSVCNSQ